MKRRHFAILLAWWRVLASSHLQIYESGEYHKKKEEKAGFHTPLLERSKKAKPSFKVIIVKTSVESHFCGRSCSTSFLATPMPCTNKTQKRKVRCHTRFNRARLSLETIDRFPKKVDRARIVPVIKVSPVVEERGGDF